MKHPPLLPTLFVVILLGIVHLQYKGQTTNAPFKELVAVGVVLFGSSYVFKVSPRRNEDVVAKAARDRDDLDRSA